MEIDKEECKSYPFKIINYDVSSELLKLINKESIPKIINGDVSQDDFKIVIAVPAVFSVDQREATLEAARKAGLKNVELIKEPIAAALAYIDSNDYNITENSCNILIYDFGGGTFDVSIVNKTNRRIDVIGSYGDDHLGGEDVTRKLEEYVKDEIRNECGDSVDLNNEKIIKKIHNECEKAKINLSSSEDYTIDYEFPGGIEFSTTLTKGTLNGLCNDIFKATIDVVEKTLKICHLKPNEIDYIVLVGGSSKIPKISDFILSYFKGGKLFKNINSEEAVVKGAAIFADYKLKGYSKFEIIDTVQNYSVCFGIDLGTTFSCSAYYNYKLNSTEVISTGQSTNSIPSYVLFNKTSNDIKPGIKSSRTDKYTIVCDSKRYLGKKRSMIDNNSLKYAEYNLTEDENGDCVYKVKHNNKTEYYSPTKISSILLRYIKDNAIKQIPNFEKEKFDEFPVIITVPADFSFFEREETIKAAKEAGFKVLHLINEPTAAAYAYIVDNETSKVINSDNYNLLIYDFGGGTFDATVLNVDHKRITVKSTIGNNNLGGQDITNKLCNYFVEKIQTENGIKLEEKAIKRIKDQCELIKIDLSTSKEVTFENDLYSEVVRRSFLDKLCESEIMKTIEIMDDAIEKAKVDIDYVVLVGGSSKLCCVESAIKRKYTKVVILKNINADEVVARGAALYARLKRDDCMKVNHIQMVDVLSKSLGYKATPFFDKVVRIYSILEKCTPLPCTGVSKAKSSKGKAIINIYEGEGKIENLRCLGSVSAYVDKDDAVVEIEYNVDVNVRLTVIAKCNGKSYNCVIEHI